MKRDFSKKRTFFEYNITVRETELPQSPPTMLTRSQSPDYWSPPPVSTHQEWRHILALLPHSHCLVSNIACLLSWLSPAFDYLLVAPVFCSPFSTVSTLCRSHWIPWKRTDYSQIRPKKPCHSPQFTRLASLPCQCSINLLLFLLPCSFVYLLTISLIS